MSYYTSSSSEAAGQPTGVAANTRRRKAQRGERSALATINPNVPSRSAVPKPAAAAILPQKRQRVGELAESGRNKRARHSFTGEVIEDLTKMSLKDEPKNLDEVNPQMPASVYTADIFAHLFRREARLHRWLRSDCLTTVQTEITGGMRAILLDWLVEVVQEFGISRESLFLAKSFIDRALSTRPFRRSELQLVGITSLLIASKMEEIYPPQISDFVYICDNTYHRDMLLEMERRLLLILNFDISIPTEISFAKRFMDAALADISPENERKRTLFQHCVEYFTDLTLLDDNLIGFKPSTIMQSVVMVAMKLLGLSNDTLEMTPTLKHYTELDSSDPELQRCIKLVMLVFLQSSSSRLRAIVEKYSSPKFSRIALAMRPVSSSAPPAFPSDSPGSFH